MPNILKRPMFRKGGSTSDGVGITSGLRKNYAEGTPKRLEYDEEKGYSIKDLEDAGLVRTGGKTTVPQTTMNTPSGTPTSSDTLSDPSFDLIRNRYQELLPTRKTNLQDLQHLVQLLQKMQLNYKQLDKFYQKLELLLLV